MSNLYLVGFMGAGKSRVGRALAAALGRPFIDLDVSIEDWVGTSIPEIFASRGEGGFRGFEREALERAARVDGSVVATGGGTACDPANRDIMHRDGGRSVFLDLPWSALAARLATDNANRPMFTTEDAARRLYELRRTHYQEASVTVPLTGRETVEDAVTRVIEALSGAACAT